MKAKHLIYSTIMVAVVLLSGLTGSIIYRLATNTSFSLEGFTFSLLLTFMFIYFYDKSKDTKKEAKG